MRKNRKEGGISLTWKILYMPLGIILIAFVVMGIIFANMPAGFEDVSTAHAYFKTILIVIIATLSIIFLCLAFLLGNVCKGIIRRLARLQKAFNKQAEGDLTYEVLVTSRDEIYQLSRVYNETNIRLNGMINNIRTHSFTLANASTEMSQSSLDITKNTTNQSDMTVQAATAMEELAASFLSVAQNSASAAEFSRDAETQAIEGGNVVTEAVKSMDKIALTVNDSAKTIGALGERSEQIGDIIRVINDIAGQTNLLALNAAIEAARAGEQGRGFAVVADEVRKLAEKTTLATQEIGEMIKGIQEETSAAVKSMESGTNEVDAGVQQANLAGNAFNEIVESIKQISDMVQQIATAAEEQSTTGTQVSSNLESVAEIARETAGVVQNSTESTQDLDLMAHELQQLVDDFKLRDGRNEGAKIVELKGPDEKKSNVVTGSSPAF